MTYTPTTVRTSIVVDAPPERAFAVFTEDMASWWPEEHHLLGAVSRMVFEPRAGGHVYDVGADGSECHWARVVAYEPPHRIVFTWDISLQWQIETDLARASEVEVRFVPQGATGTRVELEHRHLDRHGQGWEAMRDAIGGDGGWSLGLANFARRLQAENA